MYHFFKREKITQEGHSLPKTHTQNSHKHTHPTIRRKQDTNGPFQQWATIKLPGPGVLSPENDLAAAPGMPLLVATAEQHKMFIWTVCSTALTLGLAPLKAVIVLMFPDFLNH